MRDFFPLDGGLASFVKLAEHPFVSRLDFGIFFTELPMKMLACNEGQAGDS